MLKFGAATSTSGGPRGEAAWNASNSTATSTTADTIGQCPENFRKALDSYASASLAEKKNLSTETWMAGACFSPTRNIACFPEMRGQILGQNQLSIAYWRMLADAHSLPDADKGLLQSSGTAIIAFAVLLSTKIVLTVLVWQQFTCTSGQDRAGRLDCCWLPFVKLISCCYTNTPDRGRGGQGGEGKNGRGGAHRNIPRETRGLGNWKKSLQKLRKKRSSGSKHFFEDSIFKLRANQLWKSELRARDVQLILRVARIMPNWRQAQNCTMDDVGRVEVAKYILGSGGMDEDQLEGMEEMFGRERLDQEEEDAASDIVPADGSSHGVACGSKDSNTASASIELARMDSKKTDEMKDDEDAVNQSREKSRSEASDGIATTSISLSSISTRKLHMRSMPRRRRRSLDAARLRVRQSGQLPTLVLYNNLVAGMTPGKPKERKVKKKKSKRKVDNQQDDNERCADTVIF